MSEIEVFHRWTPDDRSGKDRVTPHRDGCDMDLGIQVGERIESRVIAERPFLHQSLRGIDVALDDEISFCKNLEIVRDCVREPDRRLPQKAREQELIRLAAV